MRPDGSLKPHAEVIRRFAGTLPRVLAPERPVELDASPEAYDQDPVGHARRLYEAFGTLRA